MRGDKDATESVDTFIRDRDVESSEKLLTDVHKPESVEMFLKADADALESHETFMRDKDDAHESIETSLRGEVNTPESVDIFLI